MPLLADLRRLPAPTDQSVLATNVRTRDGKRPSFADDTASWFIIPLREIVVIELPADVLEIAPEPDQPADAGGRRRTARPSADPPPAPVAELEQSPLPEADLDLSPIEPDEDLLARIRQL